MPRFDRHPFHLVFQVFEFAIILTLQLRNMNQDTALPRIVITYCTQCRWMLRAAYVCLSYVNSEKGLKRLERRTKEANLLCTA